MGFSILGHRILLTLSRVTSALKTGISMSWCCGQSVGRSVDIRCTQFGLFAARDNVIDFEVSSVDKAVTVPYPGSLAIDRIVP